MKMLSNPYPYCLIHLFLISICLYLTFFTFYSFTAFVLIAFAILNILPKLHEDWHKKQQRVAYLILLFAWLVLAKFIFDFGYKTQQEQIKITNSTILAINKYQSAHHRYPESFAQLGLSDQQMKNIQKSGLHYTGKFSEPMLFKTHPHIIFVTSDYDFKTNQWGDYKD